jgi:hypothetical protein
MSVIFVFIARWSVVVHILGLVHCSQELTTVHSSASQETCVTRSLIQSHIDSSRRPIVHELHKINTSSALDGTERNIEVKPDEKPSPTKSPSLLAPLKVDDLFADSLAEAQTRLDEEDDSGSSSVFFISMAFCVVFLLLVGFLAASPQADSKSQASYYNPVLQSQLDRQSTIGKSSMPPSARTLPPAPRPTETRLSTGYGGRPDVSTLASARQSVAPAIHLCPELVVPDMTECTLVIPQLAPSSLQTVKASIDDSAGVSVFRVEYSPSPLSDGTRLVLTSPQGDITFVTLKDSAKQVDAYDGGAIALTIFSKKERSRHFGVIRANLADGTQEVTTVRGDKIRFQGKWSSGILNAIDDQGMLLALSEPSRDGPGGLKRRTVRIGPLVDAGLMAVSFLGLDILHLELQKTPSFSANKFA